MRKIMKIAIISVFIVITSIIGLFLLSGNEAQAATRNVCPSGCAYSTIKDAVNASSGADDVINVAAGTYNETVFIPGVGSNLASYLTIKGAGIGSSIINAGEEFGFISVIPVNISGFTINSSSLGIFIIPVGSAGDIVIESNSINSTSGEELLEGGVMIVSFGGIVGSIDEDKDINIDSLKNQINKIMEGVPFNSSINNGPEPTPISNDIRIINNTIESSGDVNFGILGLGDFENQVLIEGNTITGNYVEGEYVGFSGGFGILLEGIGADKPISIKENTVNISGSGDAEFIIGIANFIVGNSDEIVINNNTVDVDNANYSFGIMSGIGEGSFSSVAIHSNIVKNAGSAGIAAIGAPSDNTPGTLEASIYNNIVYGGLELSVVIDNSPDAAGVYIGNLLEEEEGRISYNASVYNNTIYNNVASGSIPESGGIVSNNRATIAAYNNVIAQNSNGLNSSLGGSIASSYNDLYNNTESGGSNYQGVDPGEGDILDNPNFISTSSSSDNNVSAINLGLAWPSPAIDTGTSDGAASDDILGNSRPNRATYDMGAYEYQNQAPTADAKVGTGADAGKDQTVTAGAEVTLDGSGSSDPENDSLTYYWTQIEGPAMTLSDANAEQPTFTPTEVGTYKFSLKVIDQYNAESELDTVTVTVEQALLPATGADVYFGIIGFVHRIFSWF